DDKTRGATGLRPLAFAADCRRLPRSRGRLAVSREEMDYTPGPAVSAVNAPEFDNDEDPVISRMTKPTIMRGHAALSTGEAKWR
ncbi:MAG: hypothetical protein MPK75_12680, partial [Alphaproteobacteria bacterium]|nr:hypothetical protein [Alphaproteobacteria bacterium]